MGGDKVCTTVNSEGSNLILKDRHAISEMFPLCIKISSVLLLIAQPTLGALPLFLNGSLEKRKEYREVH